MSWSCTCGFLECAKFSEAEAYTYVPRRKPFGPNDPMLNPPEHKYERIVFLRYAPNVEWGMGNKFFLRSSKGSQTISQHLNNFQIVMSPVPTLPFLSPVFLLLPFYY